MNVNDSRKWKTPRLLRFACSQKQQVEEFVFQKRCCQGRNEGEILAQNIDHPVLSCHWAFFLLLPWLKVMLSGLSVGVGVI